MRQFHWKRTQEKDKETIDHWNNFLLLAGLKIPFLFSSVGFKWTAEDMNSNEKAPLTYHRIIESLKFAYAPFSFLTDPSFNNNTEKVRRKRYLDE